MGTWLAAVGVATAVVSVLMAVALGLGYLIDNHPEGVIATISIAGMLGMFVYLIHCIHDHLSGRGN